MISARSRSQCRGWSLHLPHLTILLTVTAFLALMGTHGMSDAAHTLPKKLQDEDGNTNVHMNSQDCKVGDEADACEDIKAVGDSPSLEPDIATGSEVNDDDEDGDEDGDEDVYDDDDEYDNDEYYYGGDKNDVDAIKAQLLYPSDGDCFDYDHELCLTSDFFDAYDCDTVLSQPRPIHNESTWMLLRGTYIASVGAENASIQYPASTKSGYQVAVIVQETKMAGRGVYAAEDIAKGTRIWTSRVQSAHFKTGQSYRHFLNSMGNDLVCDLLIWCYPIFLDDNDESSVHIACDLDEGSFVNHADGTNNFGCDTEAVKEFEHEGGCKENFFATRDIMEGEELRASYDEFAAGDQWSRFGLDTPEE